MKTTQRILAIFLTVSLLCSMGTMAASSHAVLTECQGQCEYTPSIVIPGLFQSQNRMYENGEVVLDSKGEPLTQLFVNIGTKDILRYVAKAIFPLILSLTLQADVGLSKTVATIAADVLGNNAKDNNGKHIKDIDVIRYPSSAARCTEEGRAYIYDTVPLEDYSAIAGADHLYFFTYDSFGSISEIADELFAFIQNVKAETGHDKVNLVPISQGGSIFNELAERYKEQLAKDVNRIVFIIPALDGSYLIGKIFNGQFIKEDHMLYRDLFPLLMDRESDQALAYGLNLAIRLLSKRMAHNIIDRTVQALIDKVLVNSTCIWALTPQSEYKDLHAKYLAGGTREKVRAEVEYYHQAQVNSRNNLLYLQSQGVKIFDLVDYDYPFYAIFPGWDTYNADGIIQLDSTSCGATSCPIAETLPADYIQQNTYCTCGGNHISPDRKVDASTGILCETTFYFDEGDHEHTASNDVLVRLAISLLTDENFQDVHTYPDKFPQYNTARVTKGLRNTLKWVKEIDLSQLDPADAAELTAAIADCEEQLDSTIVDTEAYWDAQHRLTAILVKTGKQNPPQTLSDSQQKTTDLLHRISDWVYTHIGPRGYSDVIRFQHTKW